MQSISPAIPIATPQQARAMIQDADLFFLGGRPMNLIDIEIRRETNSWITHTGLFERKAGDSIFTLESTFTQGVHEGSGASYLEGGDGPMVICRLKGITPEAAAALLSKGRSLIGRRYEVDEEIAMALHRIWKAVPVHPEWQELFCSGFVQDVCRGTAWEMAMDASGGNATPADVYAEPFVLPICAVRFSSR